MYGALVAKGINLKKFNMITIKVPNEYEYTINPDQIVYMYLDRIQQRRNILRIIIHLSNGRTLSIDHRKTEVIEDIWDKINNTINSSIIATTNVHISIDSN